VSSSIGAPAGRDLGGSWEPAGTAGGDGPALSAGRAGATAGNPSWDGRRRGAGRA